MPKIHIDEVYPRGSMYIVNFQNGYTTDAFRSKKCTLFEDRDTGERVAATELCGLLYTGKEEQEELGKTLILARNKTTGKVRVMEVGTIDMKPQINRKDASEKLLDTSHLELSRKFGSKKQKKQMEQKEKLKVNVQTVAEQMHNVTVHVTEDQLDLSSYVKTDSDDFYIPPINRQADKPEDVYDLYKILTKEEYDKIYSEIQESDYTTHLLPWIKEMVGTKKQMSEEHTVLLVYANALFKLFSTMIKDIVKKNFVACPISSTLNEIVLKNFMTNVNGRRNRPLQYKDKTFCYALVFLLLVNNLKCDIDELSKNTKYSAKTMVTKFRVIGATVVASGGKKYAQLKLPLSSVANARRKSAKF